MYKLYDCVFENGKERQELYVKVNSNYVDIKRNSISCSNSGVKIDFFTYFNSFSISKWKKYTEITSVIIKADIEGLFDIEIYTIKENSEIVIKKIENADRLYEKLVIDEIQGEIIGFRITSKKNNSKIKNITYYGEFSSWNNQKIGIVICTFKREEYVKKTIAKLTDFSGKENNDWLSVIVVDNGRTLEEIDNNKLKIIHNPNYGGSGGFTRGIIENLESNTNDYVLLMDDDIDIDTTALERTYSLLSSLKDEYKESFLSGAMLNIDEPHIQYENTAYWNKIRLFGLGKNFNLLKKENLINNINIRDYVNHYAAWWYCCIPICRIKKIGLPLPFFIKGDDIEYGIRNDREIIHINGVGVWHELFEKKQNLWVDFFSYRNFLIVNQYANGCNRWTLLIMIYGRLLINFVNGNFDRIRILNLAIQDAMQGFEHIVSIPADKKLKSVKSFSNKTNLTFIIFNIIYKSIIWMINYNFINKRYRKFRITKLKNINFWKQYLEI